MHVLRKTACRTPSVTKQLNWKGSEHIYTSWDFVAAHIPFDYTRRVGLRGRSCIIRLESSREPRLDVALDP